jgi:chromosome segregation ATPase
MKEASVSTTTTQLFRNFVAKYKANLQAKISEIKTSISELAKKEEAQKKAVLEKKKVMEDFQLERDRLYNSTDPRFNELGNIISDARDALLEEEGEFRRITDKLFLLHADLKELESDATSTLLAKAKNDLFVEFDSYNEKAAALAECISNIRALETKFRKLGGDYEFLTKFLGSGKPMGCWETIPRLVPEKNPGERTCFLHTAASHCGDTFSSIRKR